MRKTTLFRQLINSPEILLLPGVHDVLSARIGAGAGFKAMTGGGFSAPPLLVTRHENKSAGSPLNQLNDKTNPPNNGAI